MFYISALVLGVIAGVFIATIVSSFQPNRAHELYNRSQKSSKNDSLRRGSYNAVNMNSVLDGDNLWDDEKQGDDDAEDSALMETAILCPSISLARAGRFTSLVQACSTPLSSMVKHLKALLLLRSRSIRSIL